MGQFVRCVELAGDICSSSFVMMMFIQVARTILPKLEERREICNIPVQPSASSP